MFKNQADGRKNLVGLKMHEVRKQRGISQRQVADDLNEMGLIIDKNAVQRMESGQRFITDIELITIAKYLDIPLNELMASFSK
ncbi:MAG: helix-turn-helix domain-containing protein [Oscillospiraceae bacterium]|nr:helix-turn-helix domain-containing protein [Oscillospiraceae bacterium]MDY4435746.1 helix-turn-helix transcriptional regulator [Candidatus Flemingibacterium sp.]MDY4587881.1 helix-turn-helix transcriptional regulator [Oscillospiraceae bacterium]